MSSDDYVFPLLGYLTEATAGKSCISSKSLVYFYLMDIMSHITDYISLSSGLLKTF